MKKTIVTVISSAVLSAGLLSGCTEGHNTTGATLAGTAAGGLLGAALFHGEGAWIGVLGGALVGTIVGNQIGQYMDKQDEINMKRAIVNTPVGQEATWTNPKNDVTYTVKPVKNYHKDGDYCREYQTTVTIAGKPQEAYGKACRNPDGTWKVVS